MRLFLLAALTMTAFAANSVLNRAAVGGGHMTAAMFALVRLWSGAACLSALVWAGGSRLIPVRSDRLPRALALLAYMAGFSLAYRSIDAGSGALILFGGVQITMFCGALLAREPIPVRRWLGAGLAFLGLVVLLTPGRAEAIPLTAALSMAGAAIGWGIYSLLGRGSIDPVADTGASFVLAALGFSALVTVWPGVTLAADRSGVALAVVSGVITSGLGYALWYRLLPGLGASQAAVAQLTVPLIAATGGLLLLREGPGPVFLLAAAMVLGGVALALIPARRA